MKRYILFILCAICIVGCKTKKTTTINKLDLTKLSKVDSTTIEKQSYYEGSFLDRYLSNYDSTFTHIVVIRYDSVLNDSGSQKIKEQITIDQFQIRKGEDQTHSGDSIQKSAQISTEIEKRDSLKVEQTNIEIAKSKSYKDVLFGVLLVIIVCAAMALAIRKRNVL